LFFMLWAANGFSSSSLRRPRLLNYKNIFDQSNAYQAAKASISGGRLKCGLSPCPLKKSSHQPFLTKWLHSLREPLLADHLHLPHKFYFGVIYVINLLSPVLPWFHIYAIPRNLAWPFPCCCLGWRFFREGEDPAFNVWAVLGVAKAAILIGRDSAWLGKHVCAVLSAFTSIVRVHK
jgi:hypothetical protein